MLAKLLIWYLIASSGLFFCVGRGSSMENTFADGQVLILQEVAVYEPQLGDIVTFHADKLGKIIKRVIAVAGDKVEVRDHELYVNGRSTGWEGYVATQPAHILAEGYIYVVGDSYWSVDSRFLGPIAAAEVEDVYVWKLPITLPPRDKGAKK